MFLNIRWLLERRFICLRRMVVWGSAGLGCLTKLCLVTGYGVLRRKVTGYVVKLLQPSMVRLEEASAREL